VQRAAVLLRSRSLAAWMQRLCSGNTPESRFCAQRVPESVAEGGSAIAQICGCVCCGKANFEQHKASKRHARKAAAAAAAVVGAGGDAGGAGGTTAAERDRDRNCTTYVGLNSQCRPYVKQARGRPEGRAPMVLGFWRPHRTAGP